MSDTLPEIDITIQTSVIKTTRRRLGDPQDSGIPIIKVSWTKNNSFPVPTSPKDILISYNPNYPEVLTIFNGNEGVQNLPANEVIKVAVDMQSARRKQDEDVIDVEHTALLDEIVKHADDDDGSIQVLEGDADKVTLDHFSGLTASSILELVNFIKVNGLQEKKPWCVVWNLYQCMMIAAKRC